METRRRKWNLTEEQSFLDCWEGRAQDLRGCRKNSHIYKEMAVELTQAGIEVTGIEVKFKMQNLISKYKKLKAEMGPSGASPPTWPLFEKMAKIVGGYRSMNVEGVVEESFSLDTQVPSMSPIAISPAFSTQGLSSDSEQQSTSSSAQHTRSSRQQNPATANLQEITATIDKCCKNIESALKDLAENDKRKTESLAAMCETSQMLATKMMEFLNKNN
ncbi:unnamed protein product [Ceratitis capitata]|uniref:(Mediterranean fruit fly) hypothetical protein n=1 Tax=Ceratitis capitata TaxID=7213 RepID=A0A811V7X0_CERCA|nr:unnamed protein product [Ceratitis capitata]